MAHVWAWCTAWHQWTRMLLWISLLVVCVVLAWVMDTAVTGGFVEHEVVLPTSGVASSYRNVRDTCQFGHTSPLCYDPRANAGFANGPIVTIVFTKADGALVSFNCDTSGARFLADVLYVPYEQASDIATKVCTPSPPLKP